MNNQRTPTAKGKAHPRFRDVLVARISMASGREDETSTATQVDEMTEFSHVHNGTVVGTFYEMGKSAFKPGVRRDDLESAIRMVETGQADRIVFWKLDRFMRNVKRFNAMLERIESVGGHVVFKCEPWLDTSGPIGYAITGLIAALAEQESINRSERITPWHANRKANGRTPGGPRPYGFKREPNTLVVVPAEAKVIRECARRIIKGDAVNGIANDLNARGVPANDPRTGAASSWTHGRIKRIVTNPTTAGMRSTDDGTFVNGTWKSILDADSWNECRAILLAPERSVKKFNGLVYFLSGAMRCGRNECGGVMRGHKHSSRGHRYQCATCSHSIIADGDEGAETAVGDYLLSRIDDAAWRTLRARGHKVDGKALERVRKALDHERAEWLDGNRSDDEWEDAQRDIKARMQSLESADALDLPAWSSLHTEWATANASDKRMVVMAVFESITINPRAKGVNGTQRIDMRINREVVA